MKYITWDEDKNEQLKRDRGIGFEEIITAIDHGLLLETRDHPNPNKYPGQKLHILIIREYVYVVPFVEDEEKRFLKTIIPSRKETKNYFKNKSRI